MTSIEAWLCTAASTFVAVHRYTPTFCTCAFWMVNVDVGPGSGPFTHWNSDWPGRWNSHVIAGVGKPIAALQRSTCIDPFWISSFLGGEVIWEATATKSHKNLHSYRKISRSFKRHWKEKRKGIPRRKLLGCTHWLSVTKVAEHNLYSNFATDKKCQKNKKKHAVILMILHLTWRLFQPLTLN